MPKGPAEDRRSVYLQLLQRPQPAQRVQHPQQLKGIKPAKPAALEKVALLHSLGAQLCNTHRKG